MIEEVVELEDEPVEESKKSFVPQKLLDFRKQENDKKLTSDLSGIKTDFSASMRNTTKKAAPNFHNRYSVHVKSHNKPLNQNEANSQTSLKNSKFAPQQRSKKVDTLPNAPPKRSRLETLALPKARKAAEDLLTSPKA